MRNGMEHAMGLSLSGFPATGRKKRQNGNAATAAPGTQWRVPKVGHRQNNKSSKNGPPPPFFFNKKNATFFFLWFIFDTFFFFCFWPKRERENGHRLTFESSGGARRLILGVASDVFCGPIFLFGFLPFFLPILSTKTFFYRFLHFGARRSGVVFLFFFPLFRPFFLFFLGSLVYRVFFTELFDWGGLGDGLVYELRVQFFFTEFYRVFLLIKKNVFVKFGYFFLIATRPRWKNQKTR